ncbi:MAG: hypothetical protein D6772_07285 [Bacteroidetes bacterium]|nr:MAG: hypothetical protein D6772_07285 [Bacteroidota bacterium]
MKIEHLAIWVADLEKMKAFYVRYFDAKPNELYVNSRKGFQSYFLSFGEGCRLELMHQATIPANVNDIYTQYRGLIHFAISVGSKARVDELTETLRQAGYPVVGEPRTTGDGYYESVVLDPEGNRIEITS